MMLTLSDEQNFRAHIIHIRDTLWEGLSRDAHACQTRYLEHYSTTYSLFHMTKEAHGPPFITTCYVCVESTPSRIAAVLLASLLRAHVRYLCVTVGKVDS